MKQIFIVLVVVAVGAVVFFNRDNNKTVEHSGDPQSNIAPVIANAPTLVRNVASETTQTAPTRKIASYTDVPVQTKERALLIDLIKTTRAAEMKSELRARAAQLRAQINALPNKKSVLWDYYRDLQGANSAHFDRVEALDLLNGRGGDTALAEVALAEALEYAPPQKIKMEDAQTEQERNIAASTDADDIPVLVAYDIYLNNCGAYSACQQGLLTVIANNDNHNMRSSLINAVYKRFPRDKQVFTADLARYQLN
ncbi:hypothetical protein ACLVWU_17305 [Bdellovibrio sp. HCB290]|uniref:hypothetical protein n=1 Tax=Bdellovibrio sp. HCB290 TaxID=3394356 RepID=UPI0039B39B06